MPDDYSKPPWFSDLPSTWESVPVRRLFRHVKRIAGEEAHSLDRLSLTMSGVLPRDKEASDGLQPADFRGYQVIEPSDLVFKLIDLQNVRTSRVGISSARGLVSPAYITLRCVDDDLAYPRFFYYYFLDLYWRQVYQGLAADGVRANLSARDLLALPAPLPRASLQGRIAEFLDRETAQIDELIAKQEQLIATLAERNRVATDRLLLAGFGARQTVLRPGAPWLGAVPADWRVVPLWAMFRREKRVGFPQEQMLSVFRDHGVVRKDDFENLNKTAENRNIYQLVEPGWLIVNRMKAWQGSVGVSTFRGIVSGHYLCFRPIHRESSAYLNMALRSSAYTRGYLAMSRGVRPGQAEIDNDQFRATPIVLPPRDEQERIVAAVSKLSKPLEKLQARARSAIELLLERRQALISAAVTGQIDVGGKP